MSDLSEHLARVDAADPASDDPVERIQAQVAAQRQRHRERGDLDVDRYTEEEAMLIAAPTPSPSAWHSRKYAEYMQSPEWEVKRAAKVGAVGNRCERCNAFGQIQVHHKTYRDLGNEQMGDLEALCPPCHAVADKERERRGRRERANRRLDAWATKRYGEEWELRIGIDHVATEFNAWLERQA